MELDTQSFSRTTRPPLSMEWFGMWVPPEDNRGGEMGLNVRAKVINHLILGGTLLRDSKLS